MNHNMTNYDLKQKSMKIRTKDITAYFIRELLYLHIPWSIVNDMQSKMTVKYKTLDLVIAYENKKLF